MSADPRAMPSDPPAAIRHSRIRLVTTDLPEIVAEPSDRVRGPEAAARLIAAFIGQKDREHFVVVHLSTQHEPVAVETIAIGHLSAALVHPREVFKGAILANAASIIIGHNHPSGDLTFSPEDRQIWKHIREAGELVGIQVLDFLVVAGTRWCTIVQQGDAGP
ncbi:MAG: JAB domain-containing protein [Gemmatimonadota bacterium]